MTCSMHLELGAFVLHALGDNEAEDVERHLTDCAPCREEMRELAFTASLLALLTPEQVAQLENESVEGDLHRGRAGRWTRRHAAAALVAAALLVSAAVPVVRILAADEVPSAQTVTGVDRATDLRAEVTLTRTDGGTRLHLDLTDATPRGWCSLVAHSRDGRSDTAATWLANYRGAAEVTGTTAIPLDQLKELDVVTDTGRVLVTIPMPPPQT
jgi:Putative zinc-finger